MATKDKPAVNPLDNYVAATGQLLTGFSTRAASLVPAEAQPIVELLARTIGNSMSFLGKTIESALASGGAAADEIQEALDSFGAGELLEDLNKRLEEATTPADLAAIGTVLPLIKKIIRFIVDIFKLQLPLDLDKILEFIDELATTSIDFASPKGAEAMHRSEVRFLEAQFHLDRLGSLQELPDD